MKSLLNQMIIVAVLSVVVAVALRNAKSSVEHHSLAAFQDKGIVLSRTDPTIRPVSSPVSTTVQEGAQQSTDNADVQKIREGKLIKDQNAIFQIVGERISCNLNKHGVSVIVLENLTLERVHLYLLRGSDNPTWEIEGTITEYEGHNYLLLKRAIVNSLELDE